MRSKEIKISRSILMLILRFSLSLSPLPFCPSSDSLCPHHLPCRQARLFEEGSRKLQKAALRLAVGLERSRLVQARRTVQCWDRNTKRHQRKHQVVADPTPPPCYPCALLAFALLLFTQKTENLHAACTSTNTLPAHCLHTACTLPAHCLHATHQHAACTLPASALTHCLRAACTLPAHCLHTACTLPASAHGLHAAHQHAACIRTLTLLMSYSLFASLTLHLAQEQLRAEERAAEQAAKRHRAIAVLHECWRHQLMLLQYLLLASWQEKWLRSKSGSSQCLSHSRCGVSPYSRSLSLSRFHFGSDSLTHCLFIVVPVFHSGYCAL